MVCDATSPARTSRSRSSVPSVDTPIGLRSTSIRSFSRVVGSWAAVCRIARSVGPTSSSAQLAKQLEDLAAQLGNRCLPRLGHTVEPFLGWRGGNPMALRLFVEVSGSDDVDLFVGVEKWRGSTYVPFGQFPAAYENASRGTCVLHWGPDRDARLLVPVIEERDACWSPA